MCLIAKMTRERQELSYHAERGNYKILRNLGNFITSNHLTLTFL
jgi:hypothetical protein